MTKELNIEKFNPTKAECLNLAHQFKDLTIAGVDDVEGYKKVHEARMVLKKTRVEIEKTGKSLRAEAVAYQKAVLDMEHDLVDVIEPIEKDLQAKQKAIDEQKEYNKRLALVPERQAKLKEFGVEQTEEFLATLEEAQFTEYFLTVKETFLRLKEEKMQAEAKRMEDEKQAQIAKADAEAKEKQRLEDEVKAAEAKAKQDAEDRATLQAQHQKDLEAAKLKAAEDVRLEMAAKAKAEEEAKAKAVAEAEAQAKAKAERIELERLRMEKQTKYQEFLKKNGYTKETESDFYLKQDGATFTLYKKVDMIVIN